MTRKKRIKKIGDRIAKVARQANKRIAKASAVVKKKTKKSTKAALGLGKAPKREREATAGDIKRKGQSILRRNNASLARFIAARYSAKAIAKYQDYAGRLRRSRRLIKQIVEIDDNTFKIRQYIIKTDTAGNNPYSCTCPDFSQFSNDDRNWLGSKAGPFNPCKHMMAVRDRNRGGKWVCNDGVCTLDPNATNGFATKALCEASITPALFEGGQCPVAYSFYIEYDFVASPLEFLGGPPAGTFIVRGENEFVCGNGQFSQPIFGPIGNPFLVESPTFNQLFITCGDGNGNVVTLELRRSQEDSIFGRGSRIANVRCEDPIRCDGLPDNCGNPRGTCST